MCSENFFPAVESFSERLSLPSQSSGSTRFHSTACDAVFPYPYASLPRATLIVRPGQGAQLSAVAAESSSLPPATPTWDICSLRMAAGQAGQGLVGLCPRCRPCGVAASQCTTEGQSACSGLPRPTGQQPSEWHTDLAGEGDGGSWPQQARQAATLTNDCCVAARLDT